MKTAKQRELIAKRQEKIFKIMEATAAIIAVAIVVIVFLLYRNNKMSELLLFSAEAKASVQEYIQFSLIEEDEKAVARVASKYVDRLRFGGTGSIKPSKLGKTYIQTASDVKLVWEKIEHEVSKGILEEDIDYALSLSEDFDAKIDLLMNMIMERMEANTDVIMLMEAIIFVMICFNALMIPNQMRQLHDEKWRNTELSKKAFIDVHTGLPNKNMCEDVLHSVNIDDSQVCIIMFDLNDLKKVNDTMGHAYGDAMIKGFAGIVRTAFRDDDFVGRYGGDEFIAVLYNIEVDAVENILKRVASEVDKHNANNKNIHISYAYGYAHSDQYHDDSMDRLLNRADTNMYNYKKEYKRKRGQSLSAKEVDKGRLSSRIFTGLSMVSKRRYMFMCDMKTGVTRWSKNAVEYFGLPDEYLEDVATTWSKLIHPDDRDEYWADIECLFNGKKNRHDMDFRIMNKHGEYVTVTSRGVIEKGQGEESDLFIGTVTNHGISENIDAVTDLYNIYSFWNHLRERKGQNEEIYVLLLGIGNFSTINAIYGYDFGNRVLKMIAGLLHTYMDTYGCIFRMDGTKFACCLEKLSKEDVEKLYLDLKAHFSSGLEIGEVKLVFPLAGGVVSCSGDYNEYSVHAGINNALQQSKYDKSGELVFFNSESFEETKQNLAIMNELRNSIKNDCKDFYLTYQPIVSAEDDRLVGAEALLRWRSVQYGEVPPGVFIPWIENDPIFFDLGNWIIKRACEQVKPFVEQNPEFVLNINIAYSQLARNTFQVAVIDIINEIGFPGKNVCLELTERCRQLERKYLKLVIDNMKKHGIKFALDDFGTGFSSLNLLSEIAVDTLKIDRGFIFDIQENAANQAIVKAVTNCANELKIHVCAEGIEDKVLADFVKKYGVHSFQGY